MMKKFLGFSCIVVGVLFSVGIAHATPFSYTATDTPLRIPQSGTWGIAESTITVSDVLGTISDLNVFVDLNHTYMGDLDIYLIHDDTTVQLFNQHGGWGNNLTEVLFDDEASSYINSVLPPFGPGEFKPTSWPDHFPHYSNLLSSFDGMDVFGDWTLRIADRYCWDVGELLTFGIEGETTGQTAPIPEPATMLLLGSGLVGVAFFGRKKVLKTS